MDEHLNISKFLRVGRKGRRIDDRREREEREVVVFKAWCCRV